MRTFGRAMVGLALSVPLVLGAAGAASAGDGKGDVSVRHYQSVSVFSDDHWGHYGKWGHKSHKLWDDHQKWGHKSWKYGDKWDDKWDEWEDKWEDKWDDHKDKWDDHRGRWNYRW